MAEWTDREKRLYDALSYAIDYIGDGCPDGGYTAVMTEARAAMKDMHICPKPVPPPPSAADLQRLSRVFNAESNLGTTQDYTINEWLKAMLAFVH